MVKKIFIDAGGGKGESVHLALQMFGKDLEIHTFEPAPILEKFFKNLPTTLHKQAVWIYDGEIDFYVATRSRSSTLIPGRVGNIDYDNPTKVQCIDLSRWIKENFKQEDYIILKLNVEGAEYTILEKMINDGTIKYINKIYGELHAGKYPQYTEAENNKLIKLLNNVGLQWKTWKCKPRYR